jgi:hypothetical protein
MDPDAITFAVVCATIVGTVGCLVAIGIGARIMLLRAKRLGQGLSLSEGRLQHLEQAIDAIAVEVERISENQRFTTKLLAERDSAGTRGAGSGAR